MYADRVAAGTKRSIKERLDGDMEEDLGQRRKPVLKRQRQVDDKWKHDLYEGDKESSSSKSKVGPKDLRFKLQQKVPQQIIQSGKDAGVRDLREKLSSVMHSHATNSDPPNAKVVPESSIPVKKSAASVEASVQEAKKISNPTYSEKKAKQKIFLLVGQMEREYSSPNSPKQPQTFSSCLVLFVGRDEHTKQLFSLTFHLERRRRQ